jgi:hypothetical protein
MTAASEDSVPAAALENMVRMPPEAAEAAEAA